MHTADDRPRMRRNARLLARIVSFAGCALLGCGTRAVVSQQSVTAAWRRVEAWPQFPSRLGLGLVTDVAVNSEGHVLVLHRANRELGEEGLADTTTIGEPLVLVLDQETGALLRAWGSGVFRLPHSMTLDANDNVWITDVGRQQVLQFSPSGQLLRTIGTRGVGGADSAHFDLPTDVAVNSDGSFVVADGYRNSRIVAFGVDGTFEAAWGVHGVGPGQFRLPHGIARDAQGRIYVADRENGRVQKFSSRGQYPTQWRPDGTTVRVGDVAVSAAGLIYVSLWDGRDEVAVLTPALLPIASIPVAGRRIAPHALAIDGDSVMYWADPDGRSVIQLKRR